MKKTNYDEFLYFYPMPTSLQVIDTPWNHLSCRYRVVVVLCLSLKGGLNVAALIFNGMFSSPFPRDVREHLKVNYFPVTYYFV